MKTYHVIKGRVTDPDAHEGECKAGDVEWQFSDGPPGKRGMSVDFLTIEEGMAYLAPACFIVDGGYLDD